MKVAALVLGILGSLATLVVGALWTDNYKHLEDVKKAEALSREIGGLGAETKAIDAEIAAVRRKARASYPMVVLSLAAFVCAFVVLKWPRIGGSVLAIAALVPAVLAPLSLVVGFLLLLAALFAFLVRPAAPKPAAA